MEPYKIEDLRCHINLSYTYVLICLLVVAVILSDCKSNVCFSVGPGPSFRFELLSVDPWVGWLGVAKALAGRG